jgi:tetratricopeptide (TPR) repeat protein
MPPFSLYELHYNLGYVLEKQGDFAGAIANYQQAIALEPNAVQAYNNLGCVLARQGEVDAAIQVYQQAIALQPDSAILYSNLGQSLSQQGTDRKTISAAIVAYRRAIALEPDLAVAHHGLGQLLRQQGQHAAAIEHLQQAIQQHPTHWNIYAEAAFSWLALGDLDRAFALLRSVIQPQLPYVQAYWQWTEQARNRSDQRNSPIDELLQAQIACGRFLLALHQQQASSVIASYLADVYVHRATALARYGGSGQTQQAKLYYEQALQLQPDRLDPNRNLAKCPLKQAQPQPQLSAAIDPSQPDLTSTVWTGFHTSTQEWLTTHAATTDYRCLNWIRSCLTCPAADTRGVVAPQSPVASQSPIDCPVHFNPLTPFPIPAVCHGLNCSPCLKRLFQAFQLTQIDQGIHRCRGLPSIQALPLFTVTIPQGKSWATPQQNDWLVCHTIAVSTPDDSLFNDLSRTYPGHLPGCPHSSRPPQLPLPKARPIPISGTVAVLTGLSGHNYYHWMVDILPRLALLQQSGFPLDQVNRFFLNSIRQPFQRDTLAALGIPLEKIVESDRQPFIQANCLLVPSFAGPLGWLEAWAMDWLRQQFLPLAEAIAANTQLPERIYISRARANHRRVLNEAAIIDQLKAYNITPIQLETRSFAEQVALFAQAKLILAPHGGGLTNLIFCRPETIVIEFINPAYIRHYYWVISHQRSLQHYLISGQPFAGEPLRQLMYANPLLEDIWIHPEQLVNFLRSLRIK